MVEVFKVDCEACHYNGTMFDIVSQKLAKHGLLDQVSLFRMNLDNVNPYLGRFLYAPQYVFLRIKHGQITELKSLRIPGDKLNCQTFLDDLEVTSGIRLTDKI